MTIHAGMTIPMNARTVRSRSSDTLRPRLAMYFFTKVSLSRPPKKVPRRYPQPGAMKKSPDCIGVVRLKRGFRT